MSSINFVIRALLTLALLGFATFKAYLLLIPPTDLIFPNVLLAVSITISLAIAWVISPWPDR